MPETDKIKVYYLASGKIGVPLLEALLVSEKLELAGVASQIKEQRVAGPPRTMKNDVVDFCQKKKVPIERFRTVNSEEFQESFRRSGAEILIVASYGQILKPATLALPKYGCLNVHASLLPKYRGAAPIVAALLNGDAKTGVSFMRMEAGLDTGPVYSVAELDIRPDDNAKKLELRLGALAGQHIGDVVEAIVRNGLEPVPQPEEGVSYAKKVNKEDSFIDWEGNAFDIANMIRAYTPWPGVIIGLPLCNDTVKRVKLTSAEGKDIDDGAPGEIMDVGRDGFLVSCGKGSLLIKRLTPEGKNDMEACAFVLGNPSPKKHASIYSLR